MELQHVCHDMHPLVFEEHGRFRCTGCMEDIRGPSYNCMKCHIYRHKSCAELPLGLHHPLHPTHPLILFDIWRYAQDDVKDYSKCEVCKEEGKGSYHYRCSRCDFNLHIRCADLPSTMEAEVHNHPLTLLWKSFTFTCDLCGKEGKGVPYVCVPCNFWIHRGCASFPHRVKVVRHKHPLHLTHSNLEVDQSDFRFCQLCIQKVDTHYGLYYCSKCRFVAHLHCAMDKTNMEELKDEGENEDPGLDLSMDSATYKVKKIIVGKDGTEIAIQIEHFSHEHDLELNDEDVQNNEKCNGCTRAILPPSFSCAKCSFYLHKSCVELPRKKRHPLHQHPLTLFPKAPRSQTNWFYCVACSELGNGFTYMCESRWCDFFLDIQCSLVTNELTHEGHNHQLMLSNTSYKQRCNSCGFQRNQVFRCTTCEFALDFKCTTLPLTTRYKQHEHPFTLSYTVEDDSGEYYCDICEEERDPKHWFYYCADCSYPAHPKCIFGRHPNFKFGVTYTFDSHPHPVTLIEESKDHPQCYKCGSPCITHYYADFVFQCAQCNINFHRWCV